MAGMARRQGAVRNTIGSRGWTSNRNPPLPGQPTCENKSDPEPQQGQMEAFAKDHSFHGSGWRRGHRIPISGCDGGDGVGLHPMQTMASDRATSPIAAKKQGTCSNDPNLEVGFDMEPQRLGRQYGQHRIEVAHGGAGRWRTSDAEAPGRVRTCRGHVGSIVEGAGDKDHRAGRGLIDGPEMARRTHDFRGTVGVGLSPATVGGELDATASGSSPGHSFRRARSSG